jgi:signal peptidase I
MISHPHYAEKEEPRQKGGLVRSLLIIAIAAWILRSLIVAPFSIPSGSMLPELRIGDYLFAAKWPYGYSRYSFPLGIPAFSGRILGDLPERGDIVVFRNPDGNGTDVIKRVIGLPGDTVAVSDGMLVLNGRAIRREPAEPFAMPLSPNSPCRVAAGASPRVVPVQSGGDACLYPLYRETLPNGRSYLVIDQVDNPMIDDFGRHLG